MSYYKYVEPRWARALVEEGRLMFSSLAWFQESEEPSRGDEFEGVRKYFPADGLAITRLSEPAGSFVDADHSFQSAARERDHIFIYSVSRTLSPELQAKFAGPEPKEMACVEIHDIIEDGKTEVAGIFEKWEWDQSSIPPLFHYAGPRLGK